MARKFFTLAPAVIFTKQLSKGGRNQILGAVVGSTLLYWIGTSIGVPSNPQPHIKQQSVNGSVWIN